MIKITFKSALYFFVVNMVCFLIFSNALACNSSQSQRPILNVAIETNQMLLNRDFAGLDKLVIAYRKKNVLMSDGQPMLMGFYMGLLYSMTDCNMRISDAEWEKFRRLLKDWRQASSDKSAPNISLAMFELAYGWHARGGGYAYTVNEEGWRLLKERTNNAKILLDKMGKKERSDPQWYVSRLKVAAQESSRGPEYESIFNEAIKKFPTYYEFYFLYASYLHPKWGGSIEDFHQFVDQTVAKFDVKMGRVMYTRLHWSHSEDDMFTSGKTDWNRMKLGFNTMLEDFPDLWNRNHFAKFACLAKDKDTFISQLDIIKDGIISTVWRGHTDLSRCKLQFGISVFLK
jgi:hypothetical protein